MRTWLQLMCCATRRLLSLNFGEGFRGLDDEFEGQSMSISDWGAYMKFGNMKRGGEQSSGMDE